MSGGYHIPVMLKETIDSLVTRRDGRYIDCTAGGGGHCSEILGRISGDGLLVAVDRDDDAIAVLEAKFQQHGNVKIVKDDFANIGQNSTVVSEAPYDGILMDFGVSSYQIDTAERGFSFSMSGKLDMRMDRDCELTAADVVNDYSLDDLARVLKEYGEIKNSRKLAKAILAAGPLATTDELVAIAEKGFYGKQRVKMLAKIFQAIRIEVNSELDAIRNALEAAQKLLCSGGRIVTLTYHSLEDRIVKQFMRDRSGKVEVDPYRPIQVEDVKAEIKDVCRGVVLPTEEEIEINPRARSAKMRVLEKI